MILDSKKKTAKINTIISGLLITIFVIGMYFWLMPDDNWQGIKVVSGQSDSVKLPDGSMAYLIGPSQIGFPKEFSEDIRRIKMEGEVYFEIIKKPNQPFLIQSEKGGLETNGATTVVNTLGKENITIHCLSDSVRMITRGKSKNFEIVLNENEMCAFWRRDKRIEKQHFDSLDIQPFVN